MAYEFVIGKSLVSALIALLIISVFFYFAGRLVVGKVGFLSAVGTALLGVLLSFLAAWLLSMFQNVPGWVGLLVAVLAWGLAAGIMFRTSWLRGMVVGLVAWVIWFLVNWVIGTFF